MNTLDPSLPDIPALDDDPDYAEAARNCRRLEDDVAEIIAKREEISRRREAGTIRLDDDSEDLDLADLEEVALSELEDAGRVLERSGKLARTRLRKTLAPHYLEICRQVVFEIARLSKSEEARLQFVSRVAEADLGRMEPNLFNRRCVFRLTLNQDSPGLHLVADAIRAGIVTFDEVARITDIHDGASRARLHAAERERLAKLPPPPAAATGGIVPQPRRDPP